MYYLCNLIQANNEMTKGFEAVNISVKVTLSFCNFLQTITKDDWPEANMKQKTKTKTKLVYGCIGLLFSYLVYDSYLICGLLSFLYFTDHAGE